MENDNKGNKKFILINKFIPNEIKYIKNDYKYVYHDNIKMTK